MNDDYGTAAAGENSRRLYVYNGGFLTQSRIKRILALSGYTVSLGVPKEGDAVGVWGHSPTSPRGEKVAAHQNAPIIRVEDAFLRSVKTGRDGDAPLGLHIDTRGVHFDPAQKSDLELLLSEAPLDDSHLLDRARIAMARIKRAHLSKYNAFDPHTPAPEPGYVLVIDQTRGDASIKASGGDSNLFKEMLYYAQEENPGAQIIIKTHPETKAGHRDGYFKQTDCNDRISLSDAPISPHTLFEGAIAVYTVSSQMGFEAILAGHKPIVFGQPFYMGWGLTDDRKPLDRRQRKLTRAQLFAAAMILYPKWYDPYHDRLCELEDVIATLESQARAWREDNAGWVAAGMRLWKRKPLQAFFGAETPMRFAHDDKAIAKAADRKLMVWAGKTTETLEKAQATRVEDGFLRSRGLGAELIPPLSLVCDDLGIYYDPSRPSRLEQLIADATTLSDGEKTRADALITRLKKAKLSKYNVGAATLPEDLPKGRRILVPGQVEDDASIRLGASKEINTNKTLLDATRAANPAAVIIYKPHPDVEAGLRKGAITDADQVADAVLTHTDPIHLLEEVDEVWTMTSLLGFEALLRGKSVTCFGSPFYAGWGLTQDRAMPITRRAANPDLTSLVHAVLITYPRYFDPKTRLPCPVEVVVERLEAGDIPRPGLLNRLTAKAQGFFASYAHLWR